MTELFQRFEQCFQNNEEFEGRKHDTSRWVAINDLKNDILKNGMKNPLIIWKIPDKNKYLTLIGNQRLCIARSLQWKIIPVIHAKDWPESEKLKKELYA